MQHNTTQSVPAHTAHVAHTSSWRVFKQLHMNDFPVMLAPLAGVSDYPFRKVSTIKGADLTYVEMLSAVALSYHSKNTMAMLQRHISEKTLGVQITASNAESMARGITVLESFPCETIDINMGCPVRKVVKTGCGSALIRNPQKVYEVVRAAINHTNKIVTAKIRIGWSPTESYPLEVAEACAAAGAQWLTVHGRLRSDTYATPVDLSTIKRIKNHIDIPVIGNGNLFCQEDINFLREQTGVDGVMISRGALGNPWVFAKHNTPISLDEWYNTIILHLQSLRNVYGDRRQVALRFRKNLLWYMKGWPQLPKLKEKAQHITSLAEALFVLKEIKQSYRNTNCSHRYPIQTSGKAWHITKDHNQDPKTLKTHPSTHQPMHNWDPKYDMDRKLDRGVEDIIG
ncbi:MAG: tRNA-dihydrouridine synthase family protein [Proteobacteria bacterium]|nr:tRNA-dihydrouridine synthase family protein [Pseudomonadota bacterium]